MYEPVVEYIYQGTTVWDMVYIISASIAAILSIVGSTIFLFYKLNKKLNQIGTKTVEEADKEKKEAEKKAIEETEFKSFVKHTLGEMKEKQDNLIKGFEKMQQASTANGLEIVGMKKDIEAMKKDIDELKLRIK